MEKVKKLFTIQDVEHIERIHLSRRGYEDSWQCLGDVYSVWWIHDLNREIYV